MLAQLFAGSVDLGEIQAVSVQSGDIYEVVVNGTSLAQLITLQCTQSLGTEGAHNTVVIGATLDSYARGINSTIGTLDITTDAGPIDLCDIAVPAKGSTSGKALYCPQ